MENRIHVHYFEKLAVSNGPEDYDWIYQCNCGEEDDGDY